MRRFSSRSMSSMSSTTSTHAELIMASPPRRDSTKSTRNYDTGFPEPFCGTGNTTRRHPDAKTTPGAYITGADIDVNRALQRSRRTFMDKRSKYTVSYGKLEHAGPLTDLAPHRVLSASSLAATAPADIDNHAINRPVSSAQSDGSSASDSSQQPLQPSHGNKPMRDADPISSSHTQRSGSFLRKLRIRE